MAVALVLSFKYFGSRALEKVQWGVLAYGFGVSALAYWLSQIVEFPFLLRLSGIVAFVSGLMLVFVNAILDNVQSHREARATQAPKTLAPQDPQ